MSFVRPEAEAFLKRYAEVFVGSLIAVLGLYNLTRSGLVMQALGVALLIGGIAIAFTAWRRTKFPKADDGPGVVEVDERQISYFSAFAGGAVSIEALARITIRTNDTGPFGEDMFWVLEEDGGNALHIPASATGIEGLFDAFAPLKGVDYNAITQASSGTHSGEFPIWSKQRAQLH